MAIILPIFLRDDIIKMVHYLRKRMATRNVVNVSQKTIYTFAPFISFADLQARLTLRTECHPHSARGPLSYLIFHIP